MQVNHVGTALRTDAKTVQLITSVSDVTFQAARSHPPPTGVRSKSTKMQHAQRRP